LTGTGDDTFLYTADGIWPNGWYSLNAGSPGNPGTGQLNPIGGDNRSYDVFYGQGTGNTLLMGNGNNALFLDDQYSPFPGGKAQPRIVDIQTIQAGVGNQVIDLTSPIYAYGDVTLVGGTGNDELWGSSGNDLIIGGTGNDLMYGGAGNDTLIAGIGNDSMDGGSGDDTYVFNPGFGTDTIVKDAATLGTADAIQFGAGISTGDITVTRSGMSLELTDATGTITVSDWFVAADQKVQSVTFADGTVWNAATLRKLSANPPTVAHPITNRTAAQGAAFSYTIPSNTFADPDSSIGDVLSYSVTLGNGSPLPSWLSFNPATRLLSGTPPANAVGTWSIEVTATDSVGLTASTTFQLTVSPVVSNATVSLNEDSSTVLTLFPVTTDANGNPITEQITTKPAHGTLTQNADGTWTYTPNQYYFGSDSFSYKVLDGTVSSNVATVKLTVSEVEIAPTLANSSLSLKEDSSESFNPLTAATDVNKAKLTASVVTGPANGTLTINSNGTWTYKPNQYFFGTDTFTYQVSDGTDESNVATVSITVNKIEIAPTLTASSLTLNENGTSILNPLANATDVNGDPLTASVVGNPSHGTITMNADGTWTYTPKANFYGTDSFTYHVFDGTDYSNTVTVSLKVNEIEIPPTLANSSIAVKKNSYVTVNPLTYATDVNGAKLTAIILTQPSNGTITVNSNGTWTYKPSANFTGTVVVTYEVSDGSADSNVGTMTFVVS
jgi:VCBS repeat-containing protein